MSRVPRWMNVLSLTWRFALFAGVALGAQHAGPAWAGVIYVRAGATGANTGQSWTDAYSDLQAALAAATSGDEIWVARGTYRPTSGGDRNASFVLESGVGLYGGFAGTETELGHRNWAANPTILTGDIGAPGDAEDNSYHVVVGDNLAVLDGFIVTGGNGSGFGGGMYNANCSPTVTNCTFSGNTAIIAGEHGNATGGGMYNSNSFPAVTNCTFTGNTATGGSADGFGYGGGMYNYASSSPTVSSCAFGGNAAGGAFGVGAGMYNEGGSPAVSNCTFSGNTANTSGGGMNNHGSSPAVTNCAFSGNTAGGGGGMANESGSATVTNCAFIGNTASVGGGGGMYNYAGSPKVINCTFSGNTAVNGGGMYNYSSAAVTSCIFWENSAPSGAEIYKGSGTPTFRHCDIKGSGGSGALWDSALGADGGGNIGGDPRFVAPATPAGADGLLRTRDDGLRLRSDSPCIGAGDPAAPPKKDILGLRRKTVPDIGAYEFYPVTRTSADPAWPLFR